MLTVQDLTIRTREKVLIAELSMMIQPGQSWFVYGANGTGKSTMMRALAGFRNLQLDGITTQGNVLLDGRDLHTISLTQLARQRAWLPQRLSDTFGWTVFETVLSSRYPYHGGLWENEADFVIAEQALRQMDLLHLASRDIRTLSGGERQRTSIASIIAQDAPLILMDEPDAALDLPHRLALMQFIQGFVADQRRAVMTIMHDINMARLAATHVLLLLGDGRWEAGERAQVMTEEKLSQCLHCPIRAVTSHGDKIFVAG